MTDLVKRLREDADAGFWWSSSGEEPSARRHMREAADELERLTARLAEYIKANAEVGSLNVELSARLAEKEIALRQAEEAIDKMKPYFDAALRAAVTSKGSTP
jgi:uncharacterized protein YktB (UPF0637 family)